MTDHGQPWLPQHMTAEQWGVVEEQWQAANDSLDRGIALYREHREHTSCPHPACVSDQFCDAIERMPEDIAKGLLHAAIHRLEVIRLEKEAGLS